MDIKNFIKKVLTNACILFTLITAIYSITVMIVDVDNSRVLLDGARILLFFVASLLISLANTVFKIEKLIPALRLLIHFLLTTFAFYTCMMLPISPDAKTLTVGLFSFTLVYFLIMAISALFKSRYRKKSKDNTDYKEKFKKN